MTRLAAPRVLLLDLDNTVYAYSPCHRSGLEAAQTIASRLDAVWSDVRRFERDYLAARTAVKAQVGSQAASHCRLLYFKAMLEQRSGSSLLGETRQLETGYWDGYFAAMQRDEGCAETLAAVRKRGIAIVWITSFTTERQMRKLEHLGLATIANFLLTTEEAGVEKPSGRLVDLALERMGTEAEKAWVIGDNLIEDGKMAEARKLPFIWFQRDNPHPDRPDRPEHSVKNWTELQEVLRDVWN